MREKDETKRRAIRDAAVLEVIEGGLTGASMGRIAKRAGVSPGTIYLYFPSKEELLQQIYLEIKTELHHQIMAGFNKSDTSTLNIKRIWFALFEYAREHPSDFVFSEYVAAAQLLDETRKPEVEAMAIEVATILNTAIEDGTLRRVPISALTAVLIAPALQLGRRAILTNEAITSDTLDNTFDMIWRGIVAS
ncbi:MAG: TetR/AcrR family transcriptional regulator [Sneathiella sp.]|nr:TetR/AcrR family transcriptional regulator [Sneathiella sp.]